MASHVLQMIQPIAEPLKDSPALPTMVTHMISVGDAFLLFQYVLLLARPLEDMVDQLETVQKANGAMVRVIDLLAVGTRKRLAQPGGLVGIGLAAGIEDRGDVLPPRSRKVWSIDDLSLDIVEPLTGIDAERG